jgi:signal transduction histidine kinase
VSSPAAEVPARKASPLARPLWAIEKLVLVFVPFPFLDNLFEHGRFFETWRGGMADVSLAVLILICVAALHKARKRLAAIEESRSNLTELIVHDLKNPMASAISSISFLIQECGDVEKHHRLLNIAMNSCRSACGLLDRLSEIELLESAELVPRKELMDVPSSLKGCVDQIVGGAALAEVRVVGPETGPLPHVNVDPELLCRAMNNILGNALKFTPAGGQITVQAGQEGDCISIAVSDTGPGIPADQVDHVFDKYYRVRGSDRAKHRGSGLGLYFCKLAVEAHGGKIEIKSEPGKGTTVKVLLPREG